MKTAAVITVAAAVALYIGGPIAAAGTTVAGLFGKHLLTVARRRYPLDAE